MLVVKTVLRESAISGVGLFAAQDIKPGEIVWSFNDVIDIAFSAEKIDSLPPLCRARMIQFLYPIENGVFVLCGDDARFLNHSDDCNCDDVGDDIIVAKRVIHAGEEMTVCYKTFWEGYIKASS